MSKPKDKPILFEHEGVRLVKADSLNYEIQELTAGVAPKTQELVFSWKTQGYYPRSNPSVVIQGLINVCTSRCILDQGKLQDANDARKTLAEIKALILGVDL